ncbi:hypothetical protein QJS10_CPB22g00914 [Acorus calamus]|uniref:Uncharacterized protein n=1 Tax=Acorus calamus TaxID=4465 RepID=A0AAV9BY63_ACOCL|nr:hypothetical protein QJS10_CPB22g00914 [Acorus calamus]
MALMTLIFIDLSHTIADNLHSFNKSLTHPRRMTILSNLPWVTKPFVIKRELELLKAQEVFEGLGDFKIKNSSFRDFYRRRKSW